MIKTVRFAGSRTERQSEVRSEVLQKKERRQFILVSKVVYANL